MALTPLLAEPRTRPFAIDALGASGTPHALDLLESLTPLDATDAQHIAEATSELREHLSQ